MWVEVEGSDSRVEWPPHHGHVSPFSDKASLILRVLMRDTGRRWRPNDIAREAAVTKGWVSVVGQSLEERGYVDRSAEGLRLIDAPRILRDWTAAYTWRRNTPLTYYSSLDRRELLAALTELSGRREPKWALTLLTASSVISPHVEHDQIQLFVKAEHFEQFEARVRRQFYLEPVPSGGNFQLIRPYYRISAFFDVQEIKELPVVSPLQLYLDLFDYPVRGREAADLI